MSFWFGFSTTILLVCIYVLVCDFTGYAFEEITFTIQPTRFARLVCAFFMAAKPLRNFFNSVAARLRSLYILVPIDD